jgi:hypothetical protein
LGDVYAIDRGESRLIENYIEYQFVRNTDEITDDTRKKIVEQLERTYRAYLTQMETKWPIIEAIDKQITFQDIDEIIGEIERLTKDDLSECLRGLYDEGSEEFNQAMETLMTRKGALRNLFSGSPSGMAASAEIIRGPGFLQGLFARLGAGRLRDSLKLILWNLQAAFVACP